MGSKNHNVCYVCRIPNRKPSKYRVLDEKFADENQRILGPFLSFNDAFEKVKVLRGLELLGVDTINAK